MAVADELVTILGVEIGKNAMARLESFQKGIQSVQKTVLGLSVALTGTVIGAGLFIKGGVEQANALVSLSEKTGASTDALQEWAYAATKVGANATAVQGDLGRLQDKFKKSGKNSEQALEDIARKMQGMSEGSANALGKSLGLSDDTIRLLKQGKEGIKALREEARKTGTIIPKEALEKAVEFKRNVGALAWEWKNLTTHMALAAIPTLDKAVDSFRNWTHANRDWISSGIQMVIEGVATGFERFWDTLQSIKGFFGPITKELKPLIDQMNDLDMVGHLVNGTLGGLMLILAPMALKFLLIAAGIAFAALAFDDLMTYINGGDSLIGRFFNAFEERWPNLTASIKNAGKWLTRLSHLRSKKRGTWLKKGLRQKPFSGKSRCRSGSGWGKR